MIVRDLSSFKTLSCSDGILGFKLAKEGGEYRIGDRLSFYPSIYIGKYSESKTKERFLRQILYDIYEFTFIPIDQYQHEYGANHYLIETLPGFNMFHFNWTKKTDEYLKVGTLYRGFGRLSNCGNPALCNPNIDPDAMKQIHCYGILERLQVNKIWRDYDYTDDPAISDAFSYDDALKRIGYPGDMVEFRRRTSHYHDVQESLESTGQASDSDMLVYVIRMVQKG